MTDPAIKKAIADYFVDEQRLRAKLKMKFPTPNYRGLETAPGFIVVVSDFRWTRAFPVLMDGSELDRQYHENAERILLQSLASMNCRLETSTVRGERSKEIASYFCSYDFTGFVPVAVGETDRLSRQGAGRLMQLASSGKASPLTAPR